MPKIDYTNKEQTLGIIEGLIQNGEIIPALEALRLYCQSISNRDELDTVTILSSEFRQTTKDFLRGVITHDQYALVRSRITAGLLHCIAELRKNDAG